MRFSMKHRHRANQARGDARGSRAGACPPSPNVLMTRRPLGSLCVCAGTMAACDGCRSVTARPCGIAAASRPLPLTWVLVRHGDAQYPPRAFFSTCSSDQADDIVTCFIKRWSIETTFEESRAHLGFETQRQWSDLATERTTPCLLSLYSLVALLAHDLYLDGRLAIRTSSLVCQGASDVQRCFGSGTATSVGSRVFFNINTRHRVDRSPSDLSTGLDAIGLLYALTPVEFVQSRAQSPSRNKSLFFIALSIS